MSNALWPISLPLTLLIDGYSKTLPATTIRSSMDIGPDKVRQRATAGVTPRKGRLLLTADQADTLEAFFNITLAGGALPFDWNDPTQNRTTGLTGFGSCLKFAGANMLAR